MLGRLKALDKLGSMVKGKSKRAVGPNVKSVAGAAALVAGASAQGLRGRSAGSNAIVLAFAYVSSKSGQDNAGLAGLGVSEKVVAESAPFKMMQQKRDLETTQDASDMDLDAESERKMKKKESKKEAKKKKKDKSGVEKEVAEEKPKKKVKKKNKE